MAKKLAREREARALCALDGHTENIQLEGALGSEAPEAAALADEFHAHLLKRSWTAALSAPVGRLVTRSHSRNASCPRLQTVHRRSSSWLTADRRSSTSSTRFRRAEADCRR